MKISILGTRGIPNNHGGFDRAAEELSVRLAQMGHTVTVYSTDDHPFNDQVWHGVQIRRIFSHEQQFGIWGTFLYDFLCLRDAIKSDFDVILELGTYPAAVFYPMIRDRHAVLITNIDGLCWMRTKWCKLIRTFIRYCEQIAVRESDALIADHLDIKSYYKYKYGKHAHYISYGAVIPEGNNRKQLEMLSLQEHDYYMLVARLELENNIEMILDGYLESASVLRFVVVGNLTTKYSKFLLKKYETAPNIRFVGGIYNYEELSGLRKACKIYFHGHSVGGTNPSLLEAMASEAYIAAHDNQFNRGVLEENAVYFSSTHDVSRIIHQGPIKQDVYIKQNLEKIRQVFNWETIVREYESLFRQVLKNKKAVQLGDSWNL